MADELATLTPEPKFVPSQEGLAPPLDDNAVKAIFDAAAKQGIDDLSTEVRTVTAPKGQPEPLVPAVQAPVAVVPDKFKKPDGTVDEDKLKASSQKLDQALEQKQKSIDDILSEYKQKERELQGLSQKKSDLQKKVQSIPVVPPPTPEPSPTQDMGALQAQIQQDYQRDPIGTSIMLAQAIAERKIAERMAPFQEAMDSWQERERDTRMRSDLTRLSEQDPRILDNRLYAIVNQVLEDDPAMFKLKNPLKAAWNEVKERLRLGEPTPVPAQPSNPSPTLRGGSPPSVTSLPQPASARMLQDTMGGVNPLSDDGKRIEEQLRDLTRDLWQ